MALVFNSLPMETRRTQLEPNTYYHIYNRGINGQNIFLEERNYTYFLLKYAQYVSPFVDTFAYCLLKNHFHLLIRTKSEEGVRQLLGGRKEDKSVSWHFSNVFASLFQSYAQAINKKYSRTGAFFEEPFHRIAVKDEAYFSWLIWYIHYNPQKHGFVTDFRDYSHSSYHNFLVEKKTRLNKEEVLGWFGNKQGYINFHLVQQEGVMNMEDFVMEYD